MTKIDRFENFDMESHLKDRGIDMSKTRPIISGDDVYFFLYNFSGQLVGYQKYNPKNPKFGKNKENKKYYIYSGDDKDRLIVWGIESLDLMSDKFIFVVEGIFDCARIHQAGYPAIAVLTNDPKPLRGWLETLPQTRIVIYDNDPNGSGKKLRKYGHYSFTVPQGKDMNDLTPEEAKLFLKKCLDEISDN